MKRGLFGCRKVEISRRFAVGPVTKLVAIVAREIEPAFVLKNVGSVGKVELSKQQECIFGGKPAPQKTTKMPKYSKHGLEMGWHLTPCTFRTGYSGCCTSCIAGEQARQWDRHRHPGHSLLPAASLRLEPHYPCVVNHAN